MSSTRKAPSDGGGIVYSTGIGERCPNCQRPVRDCVCKKGTPGKTSSGETVIAAKKTARRMKPTRISDRAVADSVLEREGAW